MPLACSRSLFFMVFIAGALVLGVSYYLEYVVGLKPCGLCLLQRGCVALLTGVCLMAAVHGPGHFGFILYWLLGLIASLGGTVIAWRQVLLQSNPVHELSVCATNLGELFASAPWMCVVRQMFKGTVDCAQISWTLFGLSIAEWSLLFFVGMTILGIYQLLRLVWITLQRPLSGESSHRGLVSD
ncbi:disulfide bond formation protein B [Pseudomonas sp. PD9R]|uniref:disulfide bond formation protein B n=1 Tax=Pseudomonas sp. PD9R TaxID=2853534 RepID=UPI001C43FC4C|nr:disulfide bond formation protein B [Pseudomonas sp. PD9R]MBV6824731.1 disulfide bond formation protein B [Pseudomonas sp. PD9R]